MLLAADVGNTHMVFGLFEEERLLGDWRIELDIWDEQEIGGLQL